MSFWEKIKVVIVIVYVQVTGILFYGLMIYGVHSFHSAQLAIKETHTNSCSIPGYFFYCDNTSLILMNQSELKYISYVDESFWRKYAYELFYMPVNFSFFIVIITFGMTNKGPFDTWIINFIGYFISISSLVVTSRDFCLIIFRMLENGFHTLVHTPLFICSSLLYEFTILGTFIFIDSSKILRCPQEECLACTVIIHSHIIQGLCILGSFFIVPYFEFLTNNIYIVLLQNSFWITLVIYSFCTKKRLQNTREGMKSWYEWVATLCISLYLSFTVNYFYIFDNNYHSLLIKVLLSLILIIVHLFFVSIYMVHQSYFLNPYMSNYESTQAHKICELKHIYGGYNINKVNNPICRYCMNSLSSPHLEYIDIDSQNQRTYKKLKSFPRTYIRTFCECNLHLECFLNCLKYDSRCLACDTYMNRFLQKGDNYYEILL
ncbi:unnamed protein product [Moneuplotes crassus]|uniref:Uncharacterized protein n=1 Tax=Euplotes crassus TaxID=5936 RepID=A0AAD1URY4_EUPCR|nr:unnamed protein product [Moneuplotes crassus]